MRTLVTGGTGFVGSHIALALQQAGHDVRLLVRRPEQVPVTFAPFGVSFDDLVVGDILDEAAVHTAVDGCDAVVHAAAIFALDKRRAAEMLTTNEAAARLVLHAAVEAGAQQIVHISSTVAITGRGPVGPDLPLCDIEGPYVQSKVASEAAARELQAAGAPVTTVYPGVVHGPHDPYLGESNSRVQWIARGLLPMYPRGAVHTVDVRDVAAVVTAVVEGRGEAPHRYVVPGIPATTGRLYRAVGKAIGRKRFALQPPNALTLGAARATEVTQRFLPEKLRYPSDAEAIELHQRASVFDTSPATEQLGVTALPFDQSVRDTVTWLVDSGHLPEKYRPA